ncbi:MAG: hypothetical protein Q4E74_04865 [Ruminococcus sp.]|nr:hypothetical protein [Ruminococcus sp.]
MEIIEKQYLSVESLLSYKTRSTYGKLGKLIEHISESLKFLEMEQTGSIIFSLKENTYGTDETILDLEFFVPVGKEFKSNEFYVYKPQFRLCNAVRARHSGTYDTLVNSRKRIQDYLSQNSYQPITDYYYYVSRNNLVDIYVGINGNIV